MRLGFQRHVEAAVQQFLDAGEDLVSAVGVAERIFPTRDDNPALFSARKVIALTTRRLLLLNYFGVVGRHVELVAQCRREKASATLTKVFGVRLLRVDFRGAAPTHTYRVYRRFAKGADVIAAALPANATAFDQFRTAPGPRPYREVSSYTLICPGDDSLLRTDHPANRGWDRNEILGLLARCRPSR